MTPVTRRAAPVSPPGEVEHAAIGHAAVLNLVPAAHVPILRAAMADHDRDFAAFYSAIADMLQVGGAQGPGRKRPARPWGDAGARARVWSVVRPAWAAWAAGQGRLAVQRCLFSELALAQHALRRPHVLWRVHLQAETARSA